MDFIPAIQMHCIAAHYYHVQVAKDMGPGHTVVTCLCDSGQVSGQDIPLSS